MSAQSISTFIRHHFRHFNAAALIDAAQGYRKHLDGGGHMLMAVAGAMSTAELGLSLAEMIRRGKVHAISCTGANLEEDVFNLVAHDHYVRIPHYRDLTPRDEEQLLERHLNRVTDTCIPEEEAMRRIERAVAEVKSGRIEFKVDRAGIVHAPVGRASFSPDQLQANVAALVDAINRAKPSGAKGTYLRTLTLAPTMGPGVAVDIPSALAAAQA